MKNDKLVNPPSSSFDQTNQSILGDQTNIVGNVENIHYHYAESPSSGIPYQVPALPPKYIKPETALAELNQLLLDSNTNGRSVAIFGTGGIGKTSLAIAICHDQSVMDAFPDGILWVTLGPQANIPSAQSLWGREFKDDLVSLEDAYHRTERLRSLLQEKRCLLVIDDVWDVEHISLLNVGGPNCVTLITTRQFSVVSNSGFEADFIRKVDGLGEVEAERVLAEWSEDHSIESDPYRRKLARRLGFMPLALKLAGAQVRDGVSWHEILGYFQQAEPDLEQLDLDDISTGDIRRNWRSREKSLQLTFNLSLKHLEQFKNTADLSAKFALLGVFAAGREAPFTLNAVQKVWEVVDTQGSLEAGQVQRELGRLVKAALLDKTGDLYSLHLVLGDYARDQIIEHVRELKISAEKAHHDFYYQLAGFSIRDWEITEASLQQIQLAWSRVDHQDTRLLLAWPERTSRFLTRRGHWQIFTQWANVAVNAGRTEGDPNLQAWGYHYLGIGAEHFGKNDEALNHFQDALHLLEQIEHYYGVATTLSNIGRMYHKQGDLDQALLNYERSLVQLRDMSNYEGIANNLSSIGEIYRQKNLPDLALNYYEQALEIRQQLGDRGYEADAYLDVGQIHEQHGRLDLAIPLYSKGLKMSRDAGHLSGEASALDKLGKVGFDQGNYVEAEEHLKRSLEIWTKLQYGQQEASARNMLGAIYFNIGELENALTHFKNSQEIWKSLNVPLQEALNSWNVGGVLLSQKNIIEAKAYLQMAREIYESVQQQPPVELLKQLDDLELG